MFKQTRSYKESLHKRLRNNEEASEYLRVALEEGIASFLTALRNVAESRQISTIAEATALNRENLYRTLSPDGNPKLTSLAKILHSLGLRLDIAIEHTETATPVRCKVLEWKPKTTFPYASSAIRNRPVRRSYGGGRYVASQIYSLGAAAAEQTDFAGPREMTA